MKLEKIPILARTKDTMCWQKVSGKQSQIANIDILKQYKENIRILPTPLTAINPEVAFVLTFKHPPLRHTCYWADSSAETVTVATSRGAKQAAQVVLSTSVSC